MRVVHVITSLYDGGAQAVLFNLLKHDPSNEHYVISLTSEGKYSTPIREMNIEVQYLDMPLGRMRLSGLWKIYKIMKDIKPDVVQTWMYHSDLLGGLMARCAGVRNVVWGMSSQGSSLNELSRVPTRHWTFMLTQGTRQVNSNSSATATTWSASSQTVMLAKNSTLTVLRQCLKNTLCLQLSRGGIHKRITTTW